MRKIICLIIIAVIFGGLCFGYTKRVDIKHWYLNLRMGPIPESVSFDEAGSNQPVILEQGRGATVAIESSPEKNLDPISRPSGSFQDDKTEKDGTPPQWVENFNLDAPFVSQAPTGSWAQPYQDFCEEASILSVHEFYQGKSKIPRPEANEKLLAMKETEEKLFGDYISTNAKQTAKLIKEHFGYKRVDLIYDFDVNYIKKEILSRHPVIAPAAGRELGNPYFTPPGPLYHMLVIRGFTKTHFITNDVGTNTKGENFRYTYDVLMNAIHDWNDGDVYNGRRVIIVIYP